MDQISLNISIISLVISIIALIISVWHNMKSYTPIITTLQEHSNLNKEISLAVQNKGIGPAKLTKVEYFLDDNSIGNSFDEIIRVLEKKGFHFHFFFQNRSQNSVLMENEKFTPIRLVFQDSELPVEAFDLFKRVSVRIWYKSIYGINYRRKMGPFY